MENLNDQKPFDISGNLGLRLMTFHTEGRTAYREPFSWYLSGNPVVSIYGITLPFSFAVSEQERSYRQPFNMFGVSPYYKWFTLHLGYRNVSFSRYTLAGHNMLGAGFEVNHPNGIRAGFMTGRFNRAIDLEDSQTDTALFYSVKPEYKRSGHSFKIGYGTDSTHLDFSFLKARDHSNSLDSTAELTYFNVNPAENVVFGISGQHFITKQLVFSLDYANSVYTHNINEETDTVNLEGIAKSLGNSITTNSSTINSEAIETSLSYKTRNYGARFRYKRIGDGYQSMGAYYFQNDLRNITIEPWIRMLKQKMRLSASLGFQKNNLEDENRLKSSRIISSLRMNYRPANFYTINASFSNYEIERQRRYSVPDSLYHISQTTRSLGINQNLSFYKEKLGHYIGLGYNMRTLHSNDEERSQYSDYTSHNLFIHYNLLVIPANVTFEMGYNYNSFLMETGDNTARGFNAGVDKKIFKNVLKLSIKQEWNAQLVNEEKYRTINKTKLKATLTLKRTHYLTLRGDLINATGEAENVNDYNQQRFEIAYNFRF